MIDTGTQTAEQRPPARSRSLGHESSSSLSANCCTCARRAAGQRSGESTGHAGASPVGVATAMRMRCAWLLSASSSSAGRVGSVAPRARSTAPSTSPSSSAISSAFARRVSKSCLRTCTMRSADSRSRGCDRFGQLPFQLRGEIVAARLLTHRGTRHRVGSRRDQHQGDGRHHDVAPRARSQCRGEHGDRDDEEGTADRPDHCVHSRGALRLGPRRGPARLHGPDVFVVRHVLALCIPGPGLVLRTPNTRNSGARSTAL